VGASTCASGNHTCKGIIGIFTPKPKNNKVIQSNCLLEKKYEFKIKSKDDEPLFEYILNITNKTKIEPNKV